MKSDWNFDTIKTVSALGSIRGTLHELSMPPGMVPEEDESPDETFDTTGIDPNQDELRSTVIIKSRIAEEADDGSPSGRELSNQSVQPFLKLTSLFRCATCIFWNGAVLPSGIICNSIEH